MISKYEDMIDESLSSNQIFGKLQDKILLVSLWYNRSMTNP